MQSIEPSAIGGKRSFNLRMNLNLVGYFAKVTTCANKLHRWCSLTSSKRPEPMRRRKRRRELLLQWAPHTPVHLLFFLALWMRHTLLFTCSPPLPHASFRAVYAHLSHHLTLSVLALCGVCARAPSLTTSRHPCSPVAPPITPHHPCTPVAPPLIEWAVQGWCMR